MIFSQIRILLVLASLFFLSSERLIGQTPEVFDLLDSTNHYFIPVTLMHFTIGDSTMVQKYDPSEGNSGYYLHFYYPTYKDAIFSIIFLNEVKDEFSQHTHSVSISGNPEVYDLENYIDIRISGLFVLSVSHKMLSSPNGERYLLNDLTNDKTLNSMGTCEIEIKLNKTSDRIFFRVVQLNIGEVKIQTEGYFYPRKEKKYKDLLNQYLGLPILNN